MRHQADLSDSIALSDSSDSSPRANSPHGDFSLTFPQTSPQAFPQTFPQTFPQPTATNRNQQQLDFVRKKGVFYGQVSQIDQLIRKKAGFSGQTRGMVLQTDADCGLTDKLGLKFTDRHSLVFPDTCHLDFPDALHLNFPDTIYLTKATKIRNDRATVARWLGADLPPSVLEGGAREAGGPGPPRVIPRRDMVNKPQLHPVGSFAERHPANSPHGDFSQQIPKATKTPATRFCP